MKLHIVALPHVALAGPYVHLCAYSSKTVKFVKAMKDRHELILYAPENSSLPGAQLVECISDDRRIAVFGADDAFRLPDWPKDEETLSFNLRAAAGIIERSEPKDFVLLVGGYTNKPIKDVLPRMMCIEPFVGYSGILTDKCAFESYFHMAHTYKERGINDVRWFDAPVIPPYVDPDDFVVSGDRLIQGDYVLYLGRLIARKSIRLCGDIAAASGLPLVMAGPGAREWEDGKYVIARDGTKIEGDVRYFGPANVTERANLLSNARATLVVTSFFEPGCNVMFESLCCGTPVIASDAGIFPEIVKHGVNGFLIHSVREGVQGILAAPSLSKEDIRNETIANYSLEATAPKFDRWFDRLQTLWGKGFYAD